MKRTALRAAATVGVVLGLTLTASPANAANGTVGEREEVCAQTLFVRVTAPHGAYMGTLERGQTFLVEQVNGDWVYGFAYGKINRKGWVQNGWFC
jgi:hypothetical protein